jgi:arylsulfatase A-like enzyme
MPAPDYIGKSMAKSEFADSVVESDARVGRIMDKIRALRLDKNTIVFWTTDNGACRTFIPTPATTPFRGTKGTEREGGARVPAFAWMPGKIKPGSKNFDILGGLDYMATVSRWPV